MIGPIPFVAGPAWACSCKAGAGIADAELAFDGVVRSVTRDSGQQQVRFAVETVAKGEAGNEVTLATSDNEASCGYRFAEGGRYRVLSVAGTTSLCSGNELLTASPIASPGTRAAIGRVADDRVAIFWMGTGLVALFVTVGLALLIRQPKSRQAKTH
ncbi:hypothetical protein ACQP2E_00030 [Actinoplanes sp. CA-015351]|uniref:hypothetical protein n=1 Tax=Actinoplanes sp. CA-015351 TaxID=3239897 RepID=UPI003D976AB1